MKTARRVVMEHNCKSILLDGVKDGQTIEDVAKQMFEGRFDNKV